jgi:hypothetical protein
MKTYLVKYETLSGEIKEETLEAVDKPSLLKDLKDCKKIYWIRNQVIPCVIAA